MNLRAFSKAAILTVSLTLTVGATPRPPTDAWSVKGIVVEHLSSGIVVRPASAALAVRLNVPPSTSQQALGALRVPLEPVWHAGARAFRMVAGLDGVSALRIVGESVEFMDATGAPRLRARPPRSGGHDARWRASTPNCAADESPAVPWGRQLVSPGASVCEVVFTPVDGSQTALALEAEWTLTTDMAVERAEHSATVLSSGRVLVVGGVYGESSAEVFDQASGTWATTGSLKNGRYQHHAVRLASGTVLAFGGCDAPVCAYEHILTSAELYEPQTGTWRAVGALAEARILDAASALLDGRVLTTGSCKDGRCLDQVGASASAELFDPVAEKWSPAASMATSRAGHTTTLLPNGHVLAAGGYSVDALGYPEITASSEVYDPDSNTWSKAVPLPGPRWLHRAVVTEEATLVLAGGCSGLPASCLGSLYSTALASPLKALVAGGTWEEVVGLARISHGAAAFAGGVLVAGGAEASGAWSPAASQLIGGSAAPLPKLGAARGSPTVTTLLSGAVLVAGGHGESSVLSSAEVLELTVRGSGGAPGEGGTSGAGGGGAGGDGQGADARESGACGCRTPAQESGHSAVVLFAFGVLGIWRRRAR